MRIHEFVKSTPLPVSAEVAYQWHMQPGAFERLAPPWQPIIAPPAREPLAAGVRREFLIPMGPLRVRWVAEHRDFVPGRQFRDIQVEGPFALWEHTHRIIPQGDDACLLEDHLHYALPAGRLGDLAAHRRIPPMLEAMFAYRHRVTAADLRCHTQTPTGTPMKILATGSTGLVGSALIPFLTTGGHEVVRLSRRKPDTAEPVIQWDPSAGELPKDELEDFDAVIHLAGESIAEGRWTDEKKARIRNSRIEGTRLLCETLASLERKPRVLISASAIGFYGDRGDEVLTEESSSGDSFLAKVCWDWETAADPARAAGIRVVHPRIGIVLSADGGALAKMLTPFKLCAGGVVGSGKQYWSWVALDDLIGIIHHGLTRETIEGPVNAVAPNPPTNREFTKTLGKVLGRPTIFPMPAFAARVALGEMADELLLASARVIPRRLQESGYEFRFTELEAALRHTLGRG